MTVWLAVVAFCTSEFCAFYASNETFQNQATCEQRAESMTQELEQRFRGQVNTMPGCVKVPMKVT